METLKCKNKIGPRKRLRNGNCFGYGTETSLAQLSTMAHPNETYNGSYKTNCHNESLNEISSDNGKNFTENPALLDELEEEIERQLEAKARKNNLTVNNVKNLIKAVITSQDVKTLIDYNLNMSEERPPYEPKLTRAKIREIVAKEFSTAWPLLSSPKKSEIAELINRELPDDSSDEEYCPQDEVSDAESKLDDSLIEEELTGQQENAYASLTIKEPLPKPVSLDENIGQRTRSKFSLSETPLEAIEQAFIPPDITTDMYNTDCENQDWLDFLKEFTQPLSDTRYVENNDDDNDPEYNVMVDEEHEDHEEMRMDRAVKVSKKEYKGLMSEVYDYAQTLSSDEDDTPHRDQVINKEYKIMDSNSKVNSSSDITVDRANYCNDDVNSYDTTVDGTICRNEQDVQNDVLEKKIEENFFCIRKIITYKEQIMLFEQQLRQHVQLLVTQFLVTHCTPSLHGNFSKSLKSMLLSWVDYFMTSVDSIMRCQMISSLSLVDTWEKFINDTENSDKIKRFIENEMKIVKRDRRAPDLPLEIMQICKNSIAILYPLMLPTRGFLPPLTIAPGSILESEINLIIFGMHDYCMKTGHKFDIGKRKAIKEMALFIHRFKVPAWSVSSIEQYIIRACRSKRCNLIKNFVEYGNLPDIKHYVVPLPATPIELCRQPQELLPKKWCAFIKEHSAARRNKFKQGTSRI